MSVLNNQYDNGIQYYIWGATSSIDTECALRRIQIENLVMQMAYKLFEAVDWDVSSGKYWLFVEYKSLFNM